jgi:hypothetical protein
MTLLRSTGTAYGGGRGQMEYFSYNRYPDSRRTPSCWRRIRCHRRCGRPNPTLMVQPLVPRTAEVAGDADASPLVSVVGAAWLLMGQPTVAATRALEASSRARTDSASATTGPDPDRVSIIELRRPMSPPREQHGSSSERQYLHRWWVGGHWRQQACGPNHADRRPKWIAPYVKGPEGAPLTKDRVHVWRR